MPPLVTVLDNRKNTGSSVDGPTAIEPLAQSLSQEEWIQVREMAVEAFKGFREAQELADGYAFRYPNNHRWVTKLTEFATLGRRCFPSLTFLLVYERDCGPLWLHVSGPAHAKEFIHEMYSDLRKTPSWLQRRAERAIQSFRALTATARLMPHFVIIGATKCGTTSLYNYITQHPSVAGASRKELYFFDINFARGLQWYRSHFPTLLPSYYNKAINHRGLVTGEATPTYLFHPHAPRRMFDVLPNVKLISVLRNPVDRAYSHYYQQVIRGREPLSFEEAIENEAERLEGEQEKMLAEENYYSYKLQSYSYIYQGIYVDQLKVWTNYFPREQLLVLKAEDLYEQPAPVMKRVAAFLNLPTWKAREFTIYNAASYPQMSGGTRSRLIQTFQPHNRRLCEFLGADLGWD